MKNNKLILPEWINILIRTQDGQYITEICKHVDGTYSNISKVIFTLCVNGLIKTEKENRKKIVYLTEKGYTIKKALTPLNEYLEMLYKNSKK